MIVGIRVVVVVVVVVFVSMVFMSVSASVSSNENGLCVAMALISGVRVGFSVEDEGDEEWLLNEAAS